MAKNDFDIPEGLKPDVRKAAEVIVRTIRREVGKDADGGGCPLFCTVEEWKERQEEYGLTSELILVHDGGDAAPFFNLDYCSYTLHNTMFEELQKIGFWVEQCTSWYTALYRN